MQAAMLAASPKGTVPVLVTSDQVLDESLDIMLWALEHNDPEEWLKQDVGSKSEMHSLIAFSLSRFAGFFG